MSYYFNPVNCQARLKKVTRRSTLLQHLGRSSAFFELRFIERDEDTKNGVSPWFVQNMNSRCNFFAREEPLDAEEACEMRQLIHPLLPLFNETIENSEPKCRAGSLATFLSVRYLIKSGPLDAANIKTVAFDVLNGLKYLHYNLGCIHGQLSSFHVLVDESCAFAKLADGEAGGKHCMANGKAIDPNKFTVGLWSAPELLNNSQTITAKVDVFSFGLLIYEMMSSMPPHLFPGIKTRTLPNRDKLLIMHEAYKRKRIGLDIRRERRRGIARMSTAPLPLFLQPQYTCPARLENELNYGCLGTRPPMPDEEQLGQNYDDLLALFYCCTALARNDRPSVRRLLSVWNSVFTDKK
ncbi:uncharacterized protein LOC128306487 [Anopheles moucheti]|uniref:uncharacterized protein LOC128306487 n=1 Tax=Anopheles moucheti TaxID=186751 RepID=UPI0022F01CCA|nr:uncharacterized protein LOC128306487 [Anopheles moucheti]